MVALVLTPCAKRKRVTEIIVETVVRRTVVDAAVDQDTVGLVANKVSLSVSVKCLLNLAERQNELKRIHEVF